MSYEKQIEENNRDVILKKLSNDIILGQTTESTAMELDAEGGASFEQLQELIKKECDKRDKNYRSLEQKYNKLQESLEQPQQKNSKTRGQGGASNKKMLSPRTARKTQSQRGRSIKNVERNHKALDNPTHKKEKPTIPPTSYQTNTEETPCGADAHDHNRRKELPPSIGTSSDYSPEQNKTTIWIFR